jgi:hypothetical protein
MPIAAIDEDVQIHIRLMEQVIELLLNALYIESEGVVNEECPPASIERS